MMRPRCDGYIIIPSGNLQLIIDIAAPAGDRTVFTQTDTVPIPGGNGDELIRLGIGNRRIPLPERIVTPADNGTVRL